MRDASSQKKNFGSSATALVISNKEMEDIMKIVYGRIRITDKRH